MRLVCNLQEIVAGDTDLFNHSSTLFQRSTGAFLAVPSLWLPDSLLADSRQAAEVVCPLVTKPA